MEVHRVVQTKHVLCIGTVCRIEGDLLAEMKYSIYKYVFIKV